MNQRIDRVMKDAKRTKQKVSMQLRKEDSPSISRLGAKREKEKESEQTPIRVWGPYQDGPRRFRLKFAEGGVERSLSFSTLKEADAVKAELLAKQKKPKTKTIGELLKQWLEWCINVRGYKPASSAYIVRQSGWLPLRRTITSISESDAKRLYLVQTERISAHTGRKLSPATHQLGLAIVRRLWNWAMAEGYCKSNPWMKVTPIGRKPKGKPQLRIDEARKLEALALQRAHTGDVPALGILLMMYLGLRQGEVVARVARDLDDDGCVLWIPFGKTKNSRRRLKVPAHIRPLIQRLAAGKRSEELLFYPTHHKQHNRTYYIHYLQKLCRLAGVPVVVPHSLRGLHATLALEGGATADAVAKALGHSSFAMTEQHYASPSSVSNARASRVAEALGQPSPPSGDTLRKTQLLAEILNVLSSEEMSNVLTQVRPRCGMEHPLVDKQPT